MDCRDRVNVPDELVGMPGDKYVITFKWGKIKEVYWTKLEGEGGDYEPGKYYISGTWNDQGFDELKPVAGKRPGWFSTEVHMSSLGLEFKLARNMDTTQLFWPQPKNSADFPITA